MKELIGEFRAMDCNMQFFTVSVYQETYLCKKREVFRSRQAYALKGKHNEKLIPTNNPALFLRANDSFLKKISPTQSIE